MQGNGPHGAGGPTSPPMRVTGVSGATGPGGGYPTEDLHCASSVPFGGTLACVKEGFQYGIHYRPDGTTYGKWIAKYDGKNFTFPDDLDRPWAAKYVLATESGVPSVPALPGAATDAEALCWAAARQNAIAAADGNGKALESFTNHFSNGFWKDFVKDAVKTFTVAGVMTT